MLFNSVVFILLFLPITYFVYFYLNNKRLILGARTWLVAASLFFYGYWKISYLPIILASIAFNFIIGSAIVKSPKNSRINRKFVLILGIIANIAMLGYYKYTDFIIDNVNYLTGSNFTLPHIILPLAISFFTFQQITYLVDSYKGLTKEYDFLTYALFVTFFPQLIAGPIVHHKEMIPQFDTVSNLKIKYKNVASGLFIFLIGLFKKVVIADFVAQTATIGFDQAENLNMVAAWVTSLSYTIQLYYDFSGYCDMAIGAALIFNIKLPLNFNSPYKATNIQDFWRRWHMTLSRFLRDYIYIPLGGNRYGINRQCLNLFAVFVIGGIWHGANWTFVIWGVLHGVAAVIHRLWQLTGVKLNKYLSWFITFNFVNIAWIFFRAKDFASANKVLSGMFNVKSMIDLTSYKLKFLLAEINARSINLDYVIIALLIAFVAYNSFELLTRFKINSYTKSWIYGILMGISFIVLLAKIIFIPYSEFIYFNF